MNSNKTKKPYIVIIASIILLVLIGIASYSFFNIGNISISNVVNLNVATEDNNMVFDTIGGNVTLNVTVENMAEGSAGTLAAQNNTTLNITFQANTSYSVMCYYDIVWEWITTDVYNNHTSGLNADEITIQAEINGNGSEGFNHIKNETDFVDIVGDKTSEIVVSRAEISSVGSTSNTVSWDLTTRFYNVDADQSDLAGKSLAGRFKVANVKCQKGEAQVSLATYLKYNAPRSGTDAVSNSPWILTEDHPNEWRYAGKNPDNYIQFNGELWRIIGVMPNMTYCTGTYGNANECDTTATGSLVKIIRNQTISSSSMYWDYKQTGVGSSISDNGSNDWSDSQLMLMLNGTNYLKTGYDANGNKLHQSYTITSNVVAGNGYNYYNATYSYLDGNGQAVYVPSRATTSSYTATSGTLDKKIESTALNQIATVKWDLYGAGSFTTASEGSPADFYNKERNINGLGAVYTDASLPENRPVYWYGKIGLMYPSDYGYATNGGNTYNRTTCLGYQMNGWSSGSYQSDCAGGNFLWYKNITSTAPGTSGTNQWTMSPRSDSDNYVFLVYSIGGVSYANPIIATAVRPVLYLKADTLFGGGSGTWNDPYTIVDSPKQYWFALSTWNNSTNQYEPNYTFPATGGTVQTSGQATGHNVYIGQDNSKYYACATISGHEVCLSQPYTQYGLSGHTLETDFTSAQQASAKQAIYQAFIDAGISVDIDNNCGAGDSYAYCLVGYFGCEVSYYGYVDCNDLFEYVRCGVDSAGHAYCGS